MGAYEAKTRLSELLALVAQGEVVTITKHDHPIAVLGPVAPVRDVGELLAAMADLRASIGPESVDVREWIESGRERRAWCWMPPRL